MQRKVVTAADFKPPRPIADDDFEAICTTNKILASERMMVRDYLAHVVAEFGKAIESNADLPSRQVDRKAIESAIKSIRLAQHWLKRRAGTAGQRGLRDAGRVLAPALTVAWMRQRFPDHAPDAVLWPPYEGMRSPARQPARPVEVDELTLDGRIESMRLLGADAIVALLDDIAGALDAARRAIVKLPKGRKSLKMRAYMLAALAELWCRLGRRPTSGDGSQFGAFSEGVFEAVGWPPEGTTAELPKAIKLWRKLYQRDLATGGC
jgi:hypothetical protein